MVKKIGSTYARRFVKKAIELDDVFTVWRTSGETSTEGSDIYLNFSDIEYDMANTFGVDKTTSGYAMSLLHELHHTVLGSDVGGGSSLTDPDQPMSDPIKVKEWNAGEVETQMNKVRRQLGATYGQRYSYYGRPLPITKNPVAGTVYSVYYGFSLETHNKILRGEIPDEKTDHFIKSTYLFAGE